MLHLLPKLVTCMYVMNSLYCFEISCCQKVGKTRTFICKTMYACLGASTFQMSHHCLLHYSEEQKNNAVGLEMILSGDFFSF